MNIKIGGATALTLAFFAAKIFGYISWSWWAVFAPIWLPAVFGLAFLGCALFFLILVFFLDFMRTYRR